MFYDRYNKQVELNTYCGRHDGIHLYRATVTFHPGSEHQSARTKFVALESLIPSDESDYYDVALVPTETLSKDELRFALKEAHH